MSTLIIIFWHCTYIIVRRVAVLSHRLSTLFKRFCYIEFKMLRVFNVCKILSTAFINPQHTPLFSTLKAFFMCNIKRFVFLQQQLHQRTTSRSWKCHYTRIRVGRQSSAVTSRWKIRGSILSSGTGTWTRYSAIAHHNGCVLLNLIYLKVSERHITSH